MPIRNSWLPREGFTADVVGRATAKTALNPAITIPLLLFARYTYRGRFLARGHETAIRRLKLLIYLGLARWINGVLNRGVLDNWQSDKYDWKKEIVVVTGGSDGIGKKTVMLLAERGIKVVVLDIQPLTFEDATSNVLYYKCDITSPKAVAAAAAEIRSTVGHPTVLINNAGIARGKNILDSTEGDVRLTFDVNTLSHYWLVKEFLPSMINQNHGMVVTVASLAAYVTAPQMVDYAASKAAALSFHEGLAAELKTRYNAPKVRTAVITQGYTKTPLFVGFGNDSKFLMPTLEADTVAEAIVKKVLAGTSGQVVLPGAGNFIAVVLRSWPLWMQAGVRNDLDKVMRNWNGRQVIDPERRGEQETQSEE